MKIDWSRLPNDRNYRLRTLYKILDKNAKLVTFDPNWAQKDFLENIWNRTVILKARQLGFSLMIDLLFLDTCLFNSNTRAAIVADNEDNANNLFKRVKIAYDYLPAPIKAIVRAENNRAGELTFNNGSSIKVSTSARSSTIDLLHVSELGKIAIHYPQKAIEIITGAFETVPKDGIIIVESTAEGSSGAFYNLCQIAMRQRDAKIKLSQLDFKFLFYPWWKQPEYTDKNEVLLQQEDEDYFDKVKSKGIVLDEDQKTWYIKKKRILEDNMTREYPSTEEEAFSANDEAYYFIKQMNRAMDENRICRVGYDENILVDTFWDLGMDDSTSIIFAQRYGSEIRIIDYYEASGNGLSHYADVIKKKGYVYNIHYAPHDIQVKELGTGLTRLEQMEKLGVRMEIVPKLFIQEGIDLIRGLFNMFYFDSVKCERLISHIKSYHKKWNDKLGCYSEIPEHDLSSHGVDAMRYLAAIYGQERPTSSSQTIEQLREIYRRPY